MDPRQDLGGGGGGGGSDNIPIGMTKKQKGFSIYQKEHTSTGPTPLAIYYHHWRSKVRGYISMYGGISIMGASFLAPPTFCVHVGGGWGH